MNTTGCKLQPFREINGVLSKQTMNATQLPFFEPEFAEKWAEWIEYRKERRLPAYKPIGLKKTFTMLVRESGGDVTQAMDMLEYSMENNYQGIFKRKINAGTKTGQPSLSDIQAAFNRSIAQRQQAGG